MNSKQYYDYQVLNAKSIYNWCLRVRSAGSCRDCPLYKNPVFNKPSGCMVAEPYLNWRLKICS